MKIVSASVLLTLLFTGYSIANECEKLCDGDWWGTASLSEITDVINDGDVNSRDEFFGLTPLHWAARNGMPEHIAALIEAGADVNAVNVPEVNFISGLTALHQATRSDSPENVLALIKAGADINARTEKGDTPLLFAGKNTRPESVAALIEAGADLTVRNNEGETLLHYAENSDVIFALAKAGADVDARTENGSTPLHIQLSAFHHSQRYGFGNDGEVIMALIKAGADVNAPDKSGDTPLHYAARLGKPEHIVALMEAGADVNARNKNGDTPLEEADSDENLDALKSAKPLDANGDSSEFIEKFKNSFNKGHNKALISNYECKLKSKPIPFLLKNSKNKFTKIRKKIHNCEIKFSDMESYLYDIIISDLNTTNKENVMYLYMSNSNSFVDVNLFLLISLRSASYVCDGGQEFIDDLIEKFAQGTSNLSEFSENGLVTDCNDLSYIRFSLASSGTGLDFEIGPKKQ